MVCCYRQTFIIFPPHSAVECVVPTAAAAAYMALIMNFICNATGVQKKEYTQNMRLSDMGAYDMYYKTKYTP